MSHLVLQSERADSSAGTAAVAGAPPAWRSTRLLLLGIVLIAVGLRFHDISSKSYWVDEGLSFAVARLSWSSFFHTLATREANMALYFALLHFWLALGTSETAVRTLSALLSIVNVPVLYELGKRLFGRPAGLIAAWLLAINAFHVRYAQEARGYALVTLAATLATWLFVRNIQEPPKARWGMYAAACVCTIYSQFYGALLILAHCMSLPVLSGRKVAWRKLLVGLTAVGVLSVPAVLFIVYSAPGLVAWLPPVTLTGVLSFGVEMTGNYGRILFAIDGLLVGLAALLARRAWAARGGRLELWCHLVVWLWLFVPVSLVLVVSLVKPIFFPRYLLFCQPALLLLVAAGIVQLRPVQLGWMFGIVVSVCSLLGTASYYQRDFDVAHEDWRSATAYILDRVRPGDSIFFYPQYAQAPFELYRAQRNTTSAWPVPLNPLPEVQPPDEMTVAIPGTKLRSAEAQGDRVWVVFLTVYEPSGRADMAKLAVRDWFAARRYRADVRRLYPIDIVLFERENVPAAP